MQTLYLHGGEPTVHPNVVRFAQLAKEEGFHVNMFTNGIRMDVLSELDGIVDEILIRQLSCLHTKSKHRLHFGNLWWRDLGIFKLNSSEYSVLAPAILTRIAGVLK